MGMIVWEDQWATGEPLVDAQHRELFRLIDSLHEAMKRGRGQDEILPTLRGLSAYVVEHFRAEERLMESFEYPEFPEHRAFHEHLTWSVDELIEEAATGRATLGVELSQFLADWLRHHIHGTDQKMVAWVNARREEIRGEGARSE